MPPTKQLNLNIEVDVLTAGSTADVVNSILEFLLFQRNQIPFVYNTYKYYVGLWSDEVEGIANGGIEICPNSTQAVNTLHSYQLERQREQALQTKEAISAMRELIRKSFVSNNVRCLRFLFGPTTFTAKEAYTIHIPTDSISRLHFHNQHRIPNARLNQTLISLLTSEDLYSIFSHNLCPTNLYLELELLCEPGIVKDTCSKAQLLPKDTYQLPPSCKEIHFHLQHTPFPNDNDKVALNCCKEIEVFEGVMCLNINDSDSEKRNSDYTCRRLNQFLPTWWEADILVRGFKEKQIKGLNIWTK